MTSSAPHQPFPYLDPTCILWCTTEGSNTINDFLSTLPPNFLPSFLNECVKVIDLVHDHWRKKDTGGLTDSQLAIWETLKQWPIDPDQLLRVMQVYSDGKFRRGVTFKGVVDLSKGSMAYTTAQQTLYNKVFPIGQREICRMTLEQQAGLQPLLRPHPGLQKLRDQRNRNTESRKKRKFGDTVGRSGGCNGEYEEDEEGLADFCVWC
ncbi:hypothetical protein E4T52_11766 [Aureobasidium sp. EXF-3400]|nr:hypothetical protein E4T51_05140 [Aureobasidium sp. EXF-12344]KAI4773264.1 hypothetical protein E4T52_11766 [Aureobasidium sp. EXF-3400]